MIFTVCKINSIERENGQTEVRFEATREVVEKMTRNIAPIDCVTLHQKEGAESYTVSGVTNFVLSRKLHVFAPDDRMWASLIAHSVCPAPTMWNDADEA